MKYQPIGTRVLLKVIPIEQGAVQVPEHLKTSAGLNKSQLFRIEALGNAVVDENYPLAVGQTIQICSHPTLMTGVDHAQQLCCCDRKDISVICTPDEPELTLN